MPHAHSSSAASSGGDDLGSTDEVKVFKDEGDGEDEKRSSENLLEEKSSLIDWTESEVSLFLIHQKFRNLSPYHLSEPSDILKLLL
ncbi:unnamed protein product [Pieris macdunnoughi]|uniref:CTNNB1 binding N-teminal domain-containing protein n=1 Tax=Pieris macdunnoughi TaxID=345717 RepID=A0A821WAV0_9NEOP|nr:unnamed protein product [Pieris macdunnoughi]